jgi:hypothetical protein
VYRKLDTAGWVSTARARGTVVAESTTYPGAPFIVLRTAAGDGVLSVGEDREHRLGQFEKVTHHEAAELTGGLR